MKVNQKAPDFKCSDVFGRDVHLKDYYKKPGYVCQGPQISDTFLY
jgi:peroxiredoxin